MTNQNNDKSNQNRTGKDQHQQKPAQQAGQQEGQHAQQGKAGTATPNADAKPNHDNKNDVKTGDHQNHKR